MHNIAYSVRFISKIFPWRENLPFLGPQAVKNAFSWGWRNLVQFFIFMFAQERQNSFNYFFY